jgi:predicted metal-dependent HD superfamily phosphohydrolase
MSIGLWQYSASKRYYHNLAHLTALFTFLQNYRHEIDHWEAVCFSIFYHDFVYNVLRNDNEEKSAVFAIKCLQKLKVDAATIALCNEQILATKKHECSGNRDTELFTDADLMVLEQPAPVYQQYCKQIRKEYGIYPELVYKPGRKKVLLHFLKMPRIYKTSTCFSLFESQARTNLETELKGL